MGAIGRPRVRWPGVRRLREGPVRRRVSFGEFAPHLGLDLGDAGPIEALFGETAGVFGEAAAKRGVVEKQDDAGGEFFGIGSEEGGFAVLQAEAGGAGGGGGDGALHGHGFEDFEVGAGAFEGGGDDEVGGGVEALDVRDVGIDLDAVPALGEGGVGGGAPIGLRIRTGDDGPGGVGDLLADGGPDFTGEETEGGDVGEVAEGADEENVGGIGFGLGLEAGEVDAVGDDGGFGGGEETGVLGAHDGDAAHAACGGEFIAAPAEEVPAGGEGVLAGVDLVV
jgi:hypothetical protein